MRHEFPKHRFSPWEDKILQKCIHCGAERWSYANGCRTYIPKNGGKLTTTATLCLAKQPEVPEIFKTSSKADNAVELVACIILMYEELTERGISFKGKGMAKRIIETYSPVKSVHSFFVKTLHEGAGSL